jgi:hypothetical protein
MQTIFFNIAAIGVMAREPNSSNSDHANSKLKRVYLPKIGSADYIFLIKLIIQCMLKIIVFYHK